MARPVIAEGPGVGQDQDAAAQLLGLPEEGLGVQALGGGHDAEDGERMVRHALRLL
ncbi:hypothetical protein D3C86_1951590 [compost metagenome]